jgi:hypothetical protein
VISSLPWAGLILVETVFWSWWWYRRRQARAREAAEFFRADLESVRDAWKIALARNAPVMLTVRRGAGYAWWLGQPVPGEDILITTGWNLTRRALSRHLTRAAEQTRGTRLRREKLTGL